MEDERVDEHGRFRPGVVPGWGYSWWLVEQGITREAFQRRLGMAERFELVVRYWEAVGSGWWPDVPREAWVGPYHPFDPADGDPA
ncbi:MAG: hypothetical protein IRZ32_18600 [Solirubrobacteraceae bacterium]|nr:hypothetical protein [Solirubrobacteraceae bacterium]